MPELQRLHAGHAPAVLAFELANRAYFAASISDRGDEYFDQFTDRYRALLAEQEAGICAFYVLVAEDGPVLGRFNLYDLKDGTADLGYRVAEHVAGRGRGRPAPPRRGQPCPPVPVPPARPGRAGARWSAPPGRSGAAWWPPPAAGCRVPGRPAGRRPARPRGTARAAAGPRSRR